jgi:hypothetical protein
LNDPVLSDSISILSTTDERWLSFLARNPKANIFHHPAWSQLLADCYDFHPFVCALCNPNGETHAGLPFMEIHRFLRGQRWVSLPYTDHCSPLYDNVAAFNFLLEGFLNLASKHKIQGLEMREEVKRTPPLQLFSPYVLHTLPLEMDFSKVEDRIHHMHRRNAKTALKRGVRIEIGNDFEHMKVFYRLHTMTRHHKGIPVQPWRFFDLLSQNLIAKGMGLVLLAYLEEKAIAGMVLLACAQTLTYKYGASYPDTLCFRPNDLLFRSAIQWGCEHGYKVFDLGRTDVNNKGLRTFKSLWGAEEKPLSYSYLSSKTPRLSSGRWEALMHKVIRKSPVWVCRSAGELLYGHFS